MPLTREKTVSSRLSMASRVRYTSKALPRVLPAPSSWMTGDIYVQILRIVLFPSPPARVATTLWRVSCLLSGKCGARIDPELCNPRRLARPT